MIENVLNRRGVSLKIKITVKSLIAFGLIAAAVGLPQLVHLFAGSAGGAQWLPMYLPVLVGGCLLGTVWGLSIGVLSPLVSFAITAAFGNAMPAAARLPFMIAELAVFATVSGAFAGRIAANGWMAFPAVLTAEVCGRTVFMLLALVFQSVSPLSPASVWSQIQASLVAVVLYAVLVPLAVMGLAKMLDRERNK